VIDIGLKTSGIDVPPVVVERSSRTTNFGPDPSYPYNHCYKHSILLSSALFISVIKNFNL